MSSWGWVDFSKKDRELARDIIASLNAPGAVDELGIGVIRDGFADLFFPGTSTVQTIAKYFFLVAYQVEKLTRNKADNYSKALFAMEEKTSRLMWDSLTEEQRKSGNSGVFGSSFFIRYASEWVKRPPSEVYWSGIRKLRLFSCDNENISLQDFLQLAEIHHASNPQNGSDDDETVLDAKNYHWYLPPAAMRGDWENHPSIDLTPGEAKWFIDKVTEELSDTMFAFAITQREKVATLNDFSELEKLNFPAHLKAQWELAQNFSNFIKAAQTRFNYLLGNKQAKEKWDAYPGQLRGLAESVDLNGIFDVLQLKSEHHRVLYKFLTDLQKTYIAEDENELDRIITAREKALKGEARMKIGKDNPHYYDNWLGGIGLPYRFPDAKRLINDILKAEGKYHA